MDEITTLLQIDAGDADYSQELALVLMNELREVGDVRLAHTDEIPDGARSGSGMVVGALAATVTMGALFGLVLAAGSFRKRQPDDTRINLSAADLPAGATVITAEQLAELKARTQGGLTIREVDGSTIAVGGDMAGGDIIKNNVVIVVQAGAALYLGVPTGGLPG